VLSKYIKIFILRARDGTFFGEERRGIFTKYAIFIFFNFGVKEFFFLAVSNL